MVNFEIRYTDDKLLQVGSVVEAIYTNSSKTCVVKEEDLTRHCFPIGRSLWLYTTNGSVAVSGDSIRSIQVIGK